MTVNWKGDELKKKLYRATIDAVNETVSLTIRHALDNHPGWLYQTGVAEGSITQKEFAARRGRWITALWGSVWPPGKGTNYVWFLEFKHGSFLRSAADAVYPGLTKRIKARMK